MCVKVAFPASGLSCSGRRGGTSVFCSKWSYKNHHQKEWQGAQVEWARISLVGKQPDDHTDNVCLTGKHLPAAEICASVEAPERVAHDCLLCSVLSAAFTFKGVPFLYFRTQFCFVGNLFSAHD